MIELSHNSLVFRFPEVHPKAGLRIEFQRTLRLPDDGRDYPLPPGLGPFPLRHVDDFAGNLPPRWLKHGGVMLPMYQSEALWLNFDCRYLPDRQTRYPVAIKVAAGKVNAVTGESWAGGLTDKPQDYLVAPAQPWLDGYCVEKGVIRQFVAMPLGSGYTAEEQLTGQADHGGLQLAVFPMKGEVFERRFPVVKKRRFMMDEEVLYCLAAKAAGPDMGLAPGGRMRQEIYDDPFDPGDWDLANPSRCFVHLANALVWQAITGHYPPTVPPTAKSYTQAGLPWFDYYGGDLKALNGSAKLKGLKSIFQMGQEKGDVPLPENETVSPENIIKLTAGQNKNQAREGEL